MTRRQRDALSFFNSSPSLPINDQKELTESGLVLSYLCACC
ncbi:MAG: hypothetical protein WBP93_23595 [Pyrinomonadaceae bacterium]